MSRENGVFLEDIMESIQAIEKYTNDISEGQFHDNKQAQDAVVRRFEIIGDAVKNLDEDYKNKHPHIPWRKIAGMRDILIHEYFGVNISRVWEAARKDVPVLKVEINKLLSAES